MDRSKQQPSSAEILTFPHISRKDEQLLQTVLNNMSQCVLMFDSQTRLIFCNQRYLELYGLSPDIVKPGCLLRDLLRHRIERGNFSGDPDEYVAVSLRASAMLPKGSSIRAICAPRPINAPPTPVA